MDDRLMKCPVCKGEHVSVARDMIGTRVCRDCHHKAAPSDWLRDWEEQAKYVSCVSSQYHIDEKTEKDINNRFSYHPPQEGQPAKYESLRGDGLKMAYRICALVPPGRERALALTKLQEVVMWANAGIACGE